MMKYLLWLLASGIILYSACLPASDPYPYQNPSQVIAAAQQWSDSLEGYIYQWTQGQVSDSIPDALIPQGITDSKNFYLKNPDSVTAAETWAVRYAKPIDKDSMYAGVPDPKVTYLFLGTALAPFGSKLVLEGEFPHCRFFSIQVSPPINGTEYYAQRVFGTAEVSIADVDIDPLPGSNNPFRVGANRNDTNRSYRVEFDLAAGDPVALNGNGHTYPYRQASNVRTGAMLTHQGPLGFESLAGLPLPASNQGDWNLGAVWIRIYEPDDAAGPLGGVAMPKAWFELPTGEKYFVGSDFSIMQNRVDSTIANRITPASNEGGIGPATGWFKSWGITRSIMNGVSVSLGFNRQDSAARIRAIDLGWTGRGEFQPAPGNIEPHATTNNYATYLGRGISVAPGMVAVLTGRMPTFPSTRNSEPVMTAAEVRYWSIVGIDIDPFSTLPGTAIHAISDDDVTIDANRNYVIAYSRDTDRPNNAYTNNGVSWVDYGTQSNMGLLMRWVNIAPDWTFPEDPHEHQLDFSHSDWSSTLYDSSLVGINWRHGFMKCYLPRIHYMTKAEFEALGTSVSVEKVPAWVDSSYNHGPADSRLGSLSASSVYDTAGSNQAFNANDGNINTAWSSAIGQNSVSITCDLGLVRTISGIKLFWDWILFASAYSIDVSSDSLNWQTIRTITGENGQIDLYNNLQNVTGRYVRLNLTQPNVGWYRLGEFEVYTSDCDCPVTPSPTSINSITNNSELELLIYPNPVQDQLRYKLRNSYENSDELVIYDLNGKQIQRQVRPATEGVIDVTDLPRGIYIVAIRGNKQKYIGRFIKL